MPVTGRVAEEVVVVAVAVEIVHVYTWIFDKHNIYDINQANRPAQQQSAYTSNSFTKQILNKQATSTNNAKYNAATYVTTAAKSSQHTESGHKEGAVECCDVKGDTLD